MVETQMEKQKLNNDEKGDMMEIYFAPLEGITTYTYRNTHEEVFGGCDAYYAPFITPSDNEKLSIKSLRDIVPENNKVEKLIPQVMANRGESFLKFEEKIKALGYDEVNINIGCPSGTVVKKNRGAGFLRDPQGIDGFLDEVFKNSGLEISVKTRTGFSCHTEFERLLEVYNKYRMKCLIVHPRTRAEFYNGDPNMTVFTDAYKQSENKLCYNANVFTLEGYKRIAEAFPDISGVMIGRGALANPAIFREIKGGKPLETHELIEFTNLLAERYLKVLGSEVYTLHKLKEIWMYVMWTFPNEKKILKAIKKSNKLTDLLAAIRLCPEVGQVNE